MCETDLYSPRTDSAGSELSAPLRFWVKQLQRQRDFSYSCNTMGERGGRVPWELGLEVTLLHWREDGGMRFGNCLMNGAILLKYC